MVVVYIKVTIPLRKQLFDPLNLLSVLGNVGVHVQAREFLEELTRQLELLIGARRRKSGRHRIGQTALSMPTLNKLLAVRIAGFRCIHQIVRRATVHQHLARNHPQVQLGGMFEKGIHRLLMDGSEDQGRRCPVSQQFTEEDLSLGMSVP